MEERDGCRIMNHDLLMALARRFAEKPTKENWVPFADLVLENNWGPEPFTAAIARFAGQSENLWRKIIDGRFPLGDDIPFVKRSLATRFVEPGNIHLMFTDTLMTSLLPAIMIDAWGSSWPLIEEHYRKRNDQWTAQRHREYVRIEWERAQKRPKLPRYPSPEMFDWQTDEDDHFIVDLWNDDDASQHLARHKGWKVVTHETSFLAWGFSDYDGSMSSRKYG